jgi:hypothetical protein
MLSLTLLASGLMVLCQAFVYVLLATIKPEPPAVP